MIVLGVVGLAGLTYYEGRDQLFDGELGGAALLLTGLFCLGVLKIRVLPYFDWKAPSPVLPHEIESASEFITDDARLILHENGLELCSKSRNRFISRAEIARVTGWCEGVRIEISNGTRLLIPMSKQARTIGLERFYSPLLDAIVEANCASLVFNERVAARIVRVLQIRP